MANNNDSPSQSYPRPWATATDSSGEAWPLRITAADAIRLRQTRKVDLLGTNAAKLPSELSADPVACLELAFDLTAKQRQAAGLVEESQFLERFGGDDVQGLIDAVIEAIIDFFPSSRRAALTTVWKRQQGVTARMEAAMLAKMNNETTLASLDQAADKALSEFDRAIALLNQPTRS